MYVCICKTLNPSRQKRYTENDICPESQKSFKKVDNCPKNNETYIKRSIKKKCIRYQPCAGQQLVYHCVRNGVGLVEVCAPRSFITGRFCPYYEKRLGRVIENIKKRCIMCPLLYQSDEFFENSECVTTIFANEDSTDQTSSANAKIFETYKKPCRTSIEANFDDCEDRGTKESILSNKVSRKKTKAVESGDDIPKQDEKNHDDQIVIYIILSVVGTIIFLGSIIVTLNRYRNKNYRAMDKSKKVVFFHHCTCL